MRDFQFLAERFDHSFEPAIGFDQLLAKASQIGFPIFDLAFQLRNSLQELLFVHVLHLRDLRRVLSISRLERFTTIPYLIRGGYAALCSLKLESLGKSY